MSSIDKQNLIEFIEASFADSVYPGDDNLFRDVSEPDIPGFSKILRSKHWKETLGILEELDWSRPNVYDGIDRWMTLEALHYFLPAFLIIALEKRSDAFGENLFLHFDPVLQSQGESDERCFSGLSRLLSRHQKQAIAMAYQFRFGREFFVEKYWSQWLTS